jgi:Right handed beta helix region
MRSFKWPLLGLFVALFLLVAAASSAQAGGGHHGKGNGHGHGHGHHGKKVIVYPGQSIQAAVDAAKPGTTIFVIGTHQENVAITTDGLTLIGVHAVLEPAATPTQNACFDPTNPGDVNGFCVLGDVDFNTGTVNREVKNVTIKGFTVRGFSDSGIVAFGAHNATFAGNVAEDNDEYGITAFASTGTRMLFNRASGAGEAGFYIGDSPNAGAKLFGNESFDSLFGVLIRNAEHGSVFHNSFHDNCVGVVVLADAPGPAGFFRMKGNRVVHNNKACPASEDNPDPVSGIGIALVGAHDVKIKGNLIAGNVPSGDTAFTGGVVVVSGESTAPSNNVVKKNVFLKNTNDIFWDGTGTGNVFKKNFCKTSVPGGLCS